MVVLHLNVTVIDAASMQSTCKSCAHESTIMKSIEGMLGPVHLPAGVYVDITARVERDSAVALPTRVLCARDLHFKYISMYHTPKSCVNLGAIRAVFKVVMSCSGYAMLWKVGKCVRQCVCNESTPGAVRYDLPPMRADSQPKVGIAVHANAPL